MSEKYKHSERLDETLRYLNDSMSNEERYLFERELERDPFMQEAFEGLSGIRNSVIEKDIRSLDIMTGKKRKSTLIFRLLAYAAGLALLVSLGYWAIQNIDFSKQQKATNAENPDIILLREPYRPARTDTNASIDSTKVLLADALVIQQSEMGINTTSISDKDIGMQSGKSALPKTEQATAKDFNKKKPVTNSTGQKSTSPQAKNVEKNTQESSNVEKEKISTLEQEIADSNSINKSDKENEEAENRLKRPGLNAQPEPIGGNTMFKSYLENNVKYPKGIQNARKEFVRVKFKITKTGDPFGFVVEKSPDEIFSQEAIRLIKNGPKWSPKIKDGLPVEGEVSIRVYFKP